MEKRIKVQKVIKLIKFIKIYRYWRRSEGKEDIFGRKNIRLISFIIQMIEKKIKQILEYKENFFYILTTFQDRRYKPIKCEIFKRNYI